MAKKVAHSRGRGKHRKEDRLSRAERRAREQERRAAWVERWVAVAKEFTEALLNEDVDRLLGRPAGKWGDRQEQVEVGGECNKCHRKWRGWFRRNGTYPRSLTIESIVIGLDVPRLRCHCGGVVDFSFSVFAPYERISAELEERLREGVALGLTLHQVGQMTAPINGGPLAKSTINERVLDVAKLVGAFRQETLERVPSVLLVDGLWVNVMVVTEETYTNKRGQVRKRLRRQRIVLLVALGVDPKRGDWWVVDWERADQENQAGWERLLERLRRRGLTAERGLRLIVSDGSEGLAAALGLVDLGPGVKHQRCVFHKLKNLGKAVRGVLAQGQAPNSKEAREAKRQRREEVVKEAAAIYQETDRAKIEERREAFVAKWQESESEAVATLLRDFDQTLVYLEVQAAAAEQGEDWDARYLRTTSLLERLNRTLREMTDRVVLLHSEDGLDARVYLLLLQAGGILIPRGDDWLEVLEEALAAA
jgi:transposase-like protein